MTSSKWRNLLEHLPEHLHSLGLICFKKSYSTGAQKHKA